MADFNEDAVGKEVLKALVTSFGDNTFADLTVVVGDVEICCHKLVLCLHSAWFQKALTGGFKETTASHITLGEDDPDVIRAMIEYCYCLDYTFCAAITKETVLFHAKVFAAAEKYFIPTLEQRAASHFASDLEAFEPPALAFVEAAKFVYTNTSDSKKLLRGSLVKPICEDPDTINQDSGNEALTLALDSLPVFAADVARGFASSSQPVRQSKKKSTPVQQSLDSAGREFYILSDDASAGTVYGCPCGCRGVLRAMIPNVDNLYRLEISCASGSLPWTMPGRMWQSYACP